MEPDSAISDFIEHAGLVAPGDTPCFEALSGGVSSDIWIVRTERSPAFCLKRALPRLRVAADWRADVARNGSEVAWLTQVAKLDRDLVPAVLAADRALGVFAMEYLPPTDFELWKSRLARGVASADTAATVGRRLASIHAAFARSPTAAAEFDTLPSFHSLRIEPYLLATARVHAEVADVLGGLAEGLARARITVVHGDVSPKNILLGARGPVFLDAECAWFGDPAFDLAFCLNHLLLKAVWRPSAEGDLLAAFDALSIAYLGGVDWEPPDAIEERAARLLPALLLARIDGKSPVEYLTEEASKNVVRRAALEMLKAPLTRLGAVRRTWSNRDDQ